MNFPLSAARCSDFARAEDLDPAGTAGSYAGFVVVELPLPWPRDVGAHPEVAPAAAALAAAGLRVQAVIPDPAAPPGRRRVLTFRRPAGPFDAYRGRATDVAAAHVTATLAALAAGGNDTAAPGGNATAAPGGNDTAAAAGPPDGERHVLLCTHGRRDACCGTLGTRLALAVTDPGLGAGVRLWRTSHTGGHRFAPTALLLPEGTAWAYLDAATLAGIVDRTLDLAEAARHYRGCAGLDGPEVQAAEREALAAVGWGWLDHRRAGTVVGREGARTLVRLDAVAPDGTRRAFTAEVETARVMPVPDCGRPPEQAPKSAPELRVCAFAAA